LEQAALDGVAKV